MNLNLTSNILSRIKQTSIFEKKILAQNLYSKFFILNKISNTCFIVENNFKVFHLLKKDCKRFIKFPTNRSKRLLKDFVGHSFLGTPKVFRNKYSKALEFEHFLPRSYTYKSTTNVDNYVSALERSLKKNVALPCLAEKHLSKKDVNDFNFKEEDAFTFFRKQSQKKLFLSSSSKGGFKCRFNGLNGFLPVKQFRHGILKWLKKILPSIVATHGSKVSLYFWPSFFGFKSSLNRLLFFRLPFLRIIPKLNCRYRAVVDYSRSKSKKFFFGNNKKKKIFSSSGPSVDARNFRPLIKFIILCKRLSNDKKDKVDFKNNI